MAAGRKACFNIGSASEGKRCEGCRIRGSTSHGDAVRTRRMDTFNALALARCIDHTLLKADATSEEIAKLCREAKQHHFWSVCVNGSRVAQAYTLLEDSGVKVACTIGFPLGAMTTDAK